MAEASGTYLLEIQSRNNVVTGDLGTVASCTMGEQRGTHMPVELHWIGYLL